MPLARQQLEDYAESDWHYYARRVLYTKPTVPNPNNSPARIAKASGVEHHRALLLLEFFAKVPATLPLGSGTIIGLLARNLERLG